MGKRIDCLLIIKNIVFVIEFKVGESQFKNQDIDQVWDYALNLKNFHQPSHKVRLVPILVATNAKEIQHTITESVHNDKLVNPLKTNSENLGTLINLVLDRYSEEKSIAIDNYFEGSYSPTPTIIEAAISLYNQHSVEEITRNDAAAINLNQTTRYITETIEEAKSRRHLPEIK
ncbi:hypothetical protein [Riemerella columbina]|uniref:hypothetical protein n=1 Tax=Riemerella columbina TaxID=103810 RepID=UPI00266EA3B3|nr:hypothetical protein [Riemerella columbina]WKS94463.1 hypothetical protein NYR17_05850 [Riemerella columbina]